ncbi:MAG: hypothetical protein IJ228_14170 [Succinivibrio sp.]|nr:hypothetical protein [Succinivibrio sp.]
MSTIFVSFVGAQVMGTLNPLLSCISDADLRPDRIVLLCPPKEGGSESEHNIAMGADRIASFCRDEKGLEAELHHAARPALLDELKMLVAEVNSAGSRLVFNGTGGMNYQVASAACMLYGHDASIVLSAADQITCYDLSTDKLRSLAAPEFLSVQTICRLQGVECNKEEDFQDELTPVIEAVNQIGTAKVKIPKGALQHARIGDSAACDLVWNCGNNRLAFLFNTCTSQFQKSKNKKEKIRELCGWSAAKGSRDQLYDRDVYVLCEFSNWEEQARESSRQKIRALALELTPAANRDLVPIFKRLNGPLRFLSLGKAEELRQFLEDAFTVKQSSSSLKMNEQTEELASGTFAFMMGDDEAATLALLDHCPPGTKQMLMMHTSDAEHRDKAAGIRRAYNLKRERILAGHGDVTGGNVLPELDIRKVDISGSRILELRGARGENGLQVNITPGTKGQSLFLALLAMRCGGKVWSIDKNLQKRIDKPEATALAYGPCDPLSLLHFRYPRVYANLIPEENIPLCKGLLQQMKACLDQGLEWKLSEQDLSAGGYTLRRLSEGPRNDGRDEWTLITPEGNQLDFTEEGGQWFEQLTAYALEQCGVKSVYWGVRIPYSNEVKKDLKKRMKEASPNKDPKIHHRVEMDVLGVWKHLQLAVSCKAWNKFKALKEFKATAMEAQQFAVGINRFAKSLISVLNNVNHQGETLESVPISHGQVRIVSWRELCQPKLLGDLLDLITVEARTSSPALGAKPAQ